MITALQIMSNTWRDSNADYLKPKMNVALRAVVQDRMNTALLVMSST